jgi:hypothetical protein
MRKLTSLVVMLMVFGGAAALAQTGAGTGNSAGSSSKGDKLTSGGAPVGHRQPRASDAPSEKNLSNPNDPINREDAALDRKIKSICRGC